MADRLEVFECGVCGNIVEVLRGGKGKLNCCAQPMTRLVENMTGASPEKHIPIIERDGDSVEVRVGSVPHPMKEDHYIEWIELAGAEETNRRFLEPGGEAASRFCNTGSDLEPRAFCNLHGLWKG